MSYGKALALSAKSISAEKSLQLPEATGNVGAVPSLRKEVIKSLRSNSIIVVAGFVL